MKQDPNVELTEDSLKFSSIGYGGHGESEYEFSIDFYLPVNPQVCLYTFSNDLLKS